MFTFLLRLDAKHTLEVVIYICPFSSTERSNAQGKSNTALHTVEQELSYLLLALHQEVQRTWISSPHVQLRKE